MAGSVAAGAGVSIVIVCWNVRQELLDCLRSIDSEARGVPVDITVVDNASADGSVAAVQRTWPHVRVLANAVNAGFARACNQGIAATQAPYVLLLNPDCVLCNDACSALARYLDGHADAGAVGARVLRRDGSDDPRSPRRLPTLWSDFCDRTGLAERFPASSVLAGHHLPRFDRSGCGLVEALSGACLMLRRRALEQVGLLDEGYFLFGEDGDLCRRMRDAGWHVAYVGAAVVSHRGGASTAQSLEGATLHALASRQRYFRKHRGEPYAVAHRAIAAGVAGTKLAALAVPSVLAPRQRPRARLQWRVFRRCLRGTNAGP